MFIIDIAHTYTVFNEWLKQFDWEQVPLARKLEHTHQVANLAKSMAENKFKDDQEAINLTEFIGLVHDIARFVQWTRFGTFQDMKADHADLGVEVLLGEGMDGNGILIDQLAPGILENQRILDIVVFAVKWHNKLNFPEDATDEQMMFAQLLKDADTQDILLNSMKINDYEELTHLLAEQGLDIADLSNSELSTDVYIDFVFGFAIDRKDVKTCADRFVFWAGYYHNLSPEGQTLDVFHKVFDDYLNPDRFYKNRRTRALFVNLQNTMRARPRLEF